MKTDRRSFRAAPSADTNGFSYSESVQRYSPHGETCSPVVDRRTRRSRAHGAAIGEYGVQYTRSSRIGGQVSIDVGNTGA